MLSILLVFYLPPRILLPLPLLFHHHHYKHREHHHHQSSYLLLLLLPLPPLLFRHHHYQQVQLVAEAEGGVMKVLVLTISTTTSIKKKTMDRKWMKVRAHMAIASDKGEVCGGVEGGEGGRSKTPTKSATALAHELEDEENVTMMVLAETMMWMETTVMVKTSTARCSAFAFTMNAGSIPA